MKIIYKNLLLACILCLYSCNVNKDASNNYSIIEEEVWEVDSSLKPVPESFTLANNKGIIVERGFTKLLCIDDSSKKFEGSCYEKLPTYTKNTFASNKNGDSVTVQLNARDVVFHKDTIFMIRRSLKGLYAELAIYDIKNDVVKTQKLPFPDSLRFNEIRTFLRISEDPGFVKIGNWIYYKMLNHNVTVNHPIWRFNYKTMENEPLPYLFDYDKFWEECDSFRKLFEPYNFAISLDKLMRVYINKYQDKLIFAPATSPYLYEYHSSNDSISRFWLGTDSLDPWYLPKKGTNQYAAYHRIIYDENNNNLMRLVHRRRKYGDLDTVQNRYCILMYVNNKKQSLRYHIDNMKIYPHSWYFREGALCIPNAANFKNKPGEWAFYKIPYDRFQE